MIFFAVDDEPLSLSELKNAIEQAKPDCEVRAFSSANSALNAIQNEAIKPDIAFLDIELPDMSGMELAKSIKHISPKTWLIFVTGYSHYAPEAYSIHAKGYVLKPVTASKIRAELDEPCPVPLEPKKRIKVRTFGSFEVFVDGKPLGFSRSKAKELFAYLIHSRGASVTTKELAAVLFEDKPYDIRQLDYLQKIVRSMLTAFKSVGVEDVIVHKYKHYAVDVNMVDCDYFNFMDNDLSAVNSYVGEYMKQYSWADISLLP